MADRLLQGQKPPSLVDHTHLDLGVEPKEFYASETTPLLPDSSAKLQLDTNQLYTPSIATYNRRRRCGKEREGRDASPSLLSELECGEEEGCSAASSTFRGSTEVWLSPTVGKGQALHDPQYSGSIHEPGSGSHSFLARVSLTLENSGSVARDHLASERTFLAYMRTSLAFASAGVALVQLFSFASASAPNTSYHRLHIYIRPLGAGTVAVGLLVLFVGVARYFSVQAALVKGSFPVARLATGLIATLLAALVSLSFGILLAGKLEVKKG